MINKTEFESIEQRVRDLEVVNSSISTKLDIIANLLQRHIDSEESYLRSMNMSLMAGAFSFCLFAINLIIK